MDAIEQLSELIGGLLDTPLPDSDQALCDLLVGLHEAQTRLGALKAKALAAAQGRRSFAGDGSKTVSGWLARRCKASQSVIRGEARLGERLLTMPLTDAALSAADIGEDKAVKWKFHLIAAKRLDLWTRTKYLAPEQQAAPGIGAGSLLIMSPSNARLGSLTGNGWSLATIVQDAAGTPSAAILKRN